MYACMYVCMYQLSHLILWQDPSAANTLGNFLGDSRSTFVLRVFSASTCQVPSLTPQIQFSLLVSVKSKSYYSLRSNSSTLFDPPKGKMLVTLGGRSFQAAVPQLWNALPQNLRDITSVETFKKNLKTFLFRKAFVNRFTLIKF